MIEFALDDQIHAKSEWFNILTKSLSSLVTDTRCASASIARRFNGVFTRNSRNTSNLIYRWAVFYLKFFLTLSPTFWCLFCTLKKFWLFGQFKSIILYNFNVSKYGWFQFSLLLICQMSDGKKILFVSTVLRIESRARRIFFFFNIWIISFAWSISIKIVHWTNAIKYKKWSK